MPERSSPDAFVTATHEALFAPEAPACDACGAPVEATDEDEGYE